MTPLRDQIAAARALADAATNGEWQARNDMDDGWLVASFGCSGDDAKDYYVMACGVRASEVDGDAKTDAAFIAASRTLVPQLATLLERACELLEHAEECFAVAGSKEHAKETRAFLAGEVTNAK